MKQYKTFRLFATLFLIFGMVMVGCSNANNNNSSYNVSGSETSNIEDNTSSLSHKHIFSSSYEFDEMYHWHPSICGHDVVSNKESHSYVTSVTNPTYESSGYTTYTCSTCGYSYIDDEVDALPIIITWKNYDGTILEVDNNVPYGTMPSYDGKTPTKESDSNYDYFFAGWTPNVVIATEPTTYVATFSSSAIYYSISYELDGGVSNNPTSYSVESGDIILSEPTKNGYEFIGWTGSNGDIPQKNIVIDCQSATNYSFVANWQLLSYTITYHLFGGENSIKNPSIYTIEDTITLNPATKDFYDFEGWYLDANYENQITSLNGLYGELNLYAKFTPQTFNATFNFSDDCYYTITYTLDGITTDRVIKVHPNESYNIYDYIPEKDGFIFDGWYDESGVCVNGNLKLNKNMILHPIYVEYNTDLQDANGCSAIAMDNTSIKWYMYVPNYYNNNATVITSGYMRCGILGCERKFTSYCQLYDMNTSALVWNQSFTSRRVTNAGTSFTSGLQSINLEPGHYYRIDFEVSSGDVGYINFNCKCSYNLSESQISTENEIPYDSNLNIFPPNRDGYDFAGWYDESGNPIHDIWDYTGNKNFYAEWKLHQYNITYELDGGQNNPSNPISFDCTDTIELLDPSKDGYTFAGWYTDSDFNDEITSIAGDSLYSDIILYAKWIPNSYNLSLDYDGGQNCPIVEFYSEEILIKSVELFKDKTLDYFVPNSSDPSKVFAGWYTDQEFENQFLFDGTLNADLKLYAKWISVENQYAELGSDVEVIIDGKNEQYIEIVCLENQTIEISSSSDLDLFGAIYDENMDLIISNDDISSTDLDFSFTVNLEAGHKYYILYRANQVNVSGDAIINIDGKQIPNCSITGDYTEIAEVITVTYGTSFTLPEPHKEGYKFIGWFDEYGNEIDTTNWSYTSNITIYAHWQSSNSQEI